MTMVGFAAMNRESGSAASSMTGNGCDHGMTIMAIHRVIRFAGMTNRPSQIKDQDLHDGTGAGFAFTFATDIFLPSSGSTVW